MPQSQHDFRFAPTLAGFEAAAHWMTALLETRVLAGDSRHDVQLVFEEVAINIVRYGCARDDVDVDVTFEETEVVLTFEDDGKPFDPRAYPEAPAPTSLENTPIGGRGILLVRSLSSCVLYERTAQHHNRLTVVVSTH